MGKDTAMQVAQEVIEAACYDIDMDALIVNDGAQEKATALIQSALDQERVKALEEAAKLAEDLPNTWIYHGKRERFDRQQMEFQRQNMGALIAEDIRALASNQGKAE